jgi:hypothetical protein
MDRPLWTVPNRARLEDVTLVNEDDDIPIDALYDLVYVDKARLRERIDQSLQAKDDVTLSEILAKWPLEQGLSELIGYLSIFSENQPIHADAAMPTAYTWTDSRGGMRTAHMPEIVFCRRKGTGADA